MARIEVTQPNTSFTNPVWAKDYLNREHVVPGGARVDPAQFPADNAVAVTASGAAAVDEVQTVTVTGTPTGGTFTLTFDGQTTAAIPYNATAAQVVAALEALSNISSGDVSATGGPLPGTAVVVTFGGALAGTNVAQMTATGSFTGGSSPAVAVTTTTGGVAASGPAGGTTLAVSALSGPIPAGTVLQFMSGKHAYVTADAPTGATSLTVAALSQAIATGDTAQYRGTGRIRVANGTVIGRTYTERDAGTGFGPAADGDAGTSGEIYILVHDIDDAFVNPDATLYRWGSLVDEAHLPGWATLSATIQARLRVLYQCMRGAD